MAWALAKRVALLDPRFVGAAEEIHQISTRRVGMLGVKGSRLYQCLDERASLPPDTVGCGPRSLALHFCTSEDKASISIPRIATMQKDDGVKLL